MDHISFSALKSWDQCPYYFKLLYIDRIRKFEGNVYTAFGSAMHEVCEHVLVGSWQESEAPIRFEQSFLEELRQLPAEVRKQTSRDLITEMRQQGKTMSNYIVSSLQEEFGNFKVISSEENLYEPILEFDQEDYDFKGFIDLVIQTDDGKYHIIDWKTCSWGWDMKKKSDPMTTYQLTLYKHFFCRKHDIDPKDIETYFALLKRTAKKDQVEIFRVTSGAKKTKNALNLLNKALYNVYKKKFIKNKLACSKCEFFKTEYCR